MSKPLAMKELFFIFFKKITDLYKPISSIISRYIISMAFLTNILPNYSSFGNLKLEHFFALFYQGPLQEAQSQLLLAIKLL